MPVPVLLDTDIGGDVDDVFALLLAARRPEIRLLGVTVVFGPVRERARLARKMLDLTGRPDVPVAVGLGETLDGWKPENGFTSGEGAVRPEEEADLDRRLHPQSAVDFLIEQITAAAEPPVLVTIGPLTNVGAALQREPGLIQRLRALVMMGGRLDEAAEKGEYNVNSDPLATRIVLESGARLRIGTYEVTRRTVLGWDAVVRLRRSEDPACVAAAAQLERYLVALKRPATSMYDPVTLTLAYTERFLRMQQVRLAATYDTRRTHLQIRPDGPINAEVSIDIDAPAFEAHLRETLLRAGLS